MMSYGSWQFYQNLAERIHPIAIVERTEARMVLDSVTEYGVDTRLMSIYAVFKRMVMQERNRHRGMSLSDRSSRAVPPDKLIEEVRSGVGLALPAKFKRRIRGMGGGEELTGDELLEAQLKWIAAALTAADIAEEANMRGEAKETVNRHLDPYIYSHTLMTATWNVWLNFLGLRLANADPSIEVLANCVYYAIKGSTPKLLKPGDWHLPFVDPFVDEAQIRVAVAHLRMMIGHSQSDCIGAVSRDLSAARSAHLSFNDLGTGQRMTVERALSIANSLRDPSHSLHASPFEHQATPDHKVWTHDEVVTWERPELHGNFCGWIQSRKTMPGEAVAKLPEGYEL